MTSLGRWDCIVVAIYCDKNGWNHHGPSLSQTAGKKVNAALRQILVRFCKSMLLAILSSSFFFEGALPSASTRLLNSPSIAMKKSHVLPTRSLVRRANVVLSRLAFNMGKVRSQCPQSQCMSENGIPQPEPLDLMQPASKSQNHVVSHPCIKKSYLTPRPAT